MSIDMFIPILFLCALFAIVILVGIGFSYISLRWFHAQLTKCPECGRKGAGELLHSEVVGSKSHIEWDEGRKRWGQIRGRHQRVRVTENTIEDRFRCEFCGHEWTTTARETKRAVIAPHESR